MKQKNEGIYYNVASLDEGIIAKRQVSFAYFYYNDIGKCMYRKEEIIKLLNTGDKLSTFDETIFKSLVREIKVTAPKEIEISYNCGLTVKEQIK